MHFGICGGCRCAPQAGADPRPPPYAEELRQKEERVRMLLGAYEVGEWRSIIPSPEEWNYRNKMEYAFAVWDDQLVLGLREEGRFDHIVDLETCGLMSDEAITVLKLIRRWAKEQGLRGYHRRRHEGDVRYLVIREGKNTGERMAILLATSQGAAHCDKKTFESLRPLVSSFWLGVTDAKSDLARADDMRLLWGPGAITEKILERTYRISPFSFFQTNTHGTEKLYALLREWSAGIVGALIDLYCGSGGIALALADRFDRVIGVDTNADAIADAQQAAKANGLSNLEFVCEDALEFLKKLPGSKLHVQQSAMTVDPPRTGLHPRAMEALVELNPARLAYISCNPESLARDLQHLVPFYKIRRAQSVDLFPHTAHVETVVFLEHR